MKGNLFAFALGVILAYGVGTYSYRPAQTATPVQMPVAQAASPGVAMAAAPAAPEPVRELVPRPQPQSARVRRPAEQARARRTAAPAERRPNFTPAPKAAPEISEPEIEEQIAPEPAPVREVAEARVPEIEPAGPEIEAVPPAPAPDRRRSRGRSVAIIGGSAAGGAVIGGVAGGGKGAAIGGVLGAAGGYIYDRITRR